MATLLSTMTGQWAGPGPSYFRVIAQIWQNKDTGKGYDLYLRQYVEVKSGSGFGGTVVTTSWNGSITLNGAGAFGIKETQLGVIAYGKSYTLAASSTKAYYSDSAGNTYTSSVNVNYTVPNPTYTLTFNPNGGELLNPGENLYNGTNTDSVTVTYMKGGYGRMLNDIPTRTGYTFIGWYTAASGGDQVYDSTGYCIAGTYWNSDRKWIYKGDLTVYAQWEKTITLSYDANGGSGAPNSQSATIYNATTSYKFTLSNTKPTRTGYTFLHWNTKADGSGTSYGAGSTCTISDTTTLYAQWSRNVRIVTFDANGGTVSQSSKSIYQYDTVGTLPIPTRKNYSFLGWNTKSNGSGDYISSDYVVKNNVTVYAIWKLQSNTYIRRNGIYKVGIMYVRQNGKYVGGGITEVKDGGTWI